MADETGSDEKKNKPRLTKSQIHSASDVAYIASRGKILEDYMLVEVILDYSDYGQRYPQDLLEYLAEKFSEIVSEDTEAIVNLRGFSHGQDNCQYRYHGTALVPKNKLPEGVNRQ